MPDTISRPIVIIDKLQWDREPLPSAKEAFQRIRRGRILYNFQKDVPHTAGIGRILFNGRQRSLL